MKKIIVLIALFLLIPVNSYCQDTTEIQFIYINGSNNNDKKMTDWFFEGVQKMHPHMYNAFNNSEFINQKFWITENIK